MSFAAIVYNDVILHSGKAVLLNLELTGSSGGVGLGDRYDQLGLCVWEGSNGPCRVGVVLK